MKKETFHVIELAEGSYFCGGRSLSGRLEWGSVGTPLLAKRVDPERADLTEIHAVLPDARIVLIEVSYKVLP